MVGLFRCPFPASWRCCSLRQRAFPPACSALRAFAASASSSGESPVEHFPLTLLLPVIRGPATLASISRILRSALAFEFAYALAVQGYSRRKLDSSEVFVDASFRPKFLDAGASAGPVFSPSTYNSIILMRFFIRHLAQTGLERSEKAVTFYHYRGLTSGLRSRYINVFLGPYPRAALSSRSCSLESHSDLHSQVRE